MHDLFRRPVCTSEDGLSVPAFHTGALRYAGIDTVVEKLQKHDTFYECCAMTSYTLADLTKLTGAKRRSVQFWTEAGAVRAEAETERSGSGTHRRFSRDEAIIACVLNQFAQQQIAIGHLIEVSIGFRHLLDLYDGEVRRAAQSPSDNSGCATYAT